jgi:ribosomal protein S18 acetylase RimI-like enzyme
MVKKMTIIHWTQGQKTHTLRELFIEYWHDERIIVHENVYHPQHLESLVALDETKTIQGLLTFVVANSELEIITLDSFIKGQGIGSQLLKSAEQEATKRHCKRLWLVTTNDNLHALGFYQRRGFQIMKVTPNAVEKARVLKPSIPLIAENGIPIRDELMLEKSVVL